MQPNYDLIYLRAGLEILKDYLLSDELYWEIGVASPPGTPAYPQLTLGNLLLSRARLSGLSPAPGDDEALQPLMAGLAEIHSQWTVAWEKKASREFEARLKLWADYLEEYRDNPAGQVDRYAYEVRRRAILDLLHDGGAQVGETSSRLLAGMDAMLKTVLVPAEFVWDDGVSDAFPPDRYWYLYGKPRPR